MRFRNKNLNVGSVDIDKPVTKIFQVYNNSASQMKMELENEIPEEMSVEFEPKSIPPKYVGNIRVSYTATSETAFGMQKNSGKKSKPMIFRHLLKHSMLTIMFKSHFRKNKKIIQIDLFLWLVRKDTYLGSVKEGETVKTEITYTNTGKSPLLIRSIMSSCACLVTKSGKDKIPPGGSAKIKVKFDSSGKSSYVNNKVTFVTNDPVKPKQVVTVRAKVVE